MRRCLGFGVVLAALSAVYGAPSEEELAEKYLFKVENPTPILFFHDHYINLYIEKSGMSGKATTERLWELRGNLWKSDRIQDFPRNGEDFSVGVKQSPYASFMAPDVSGQAVWEFKDDDGRAHVGEGEFNIPLEVTDAASLQIKGQVRLHDTLTDSDEQQYWGQFFKCANTDIWGYPAARTFWFVSRGDIEDRWQKLLSKGETKFVLAEMNFLRGEEGRGRFDGPGGKAWEFFVSNFFKENIGTTLKIINGTGGVRDGEIALFDERANIPRMDVGADCFYENLSQAFETPWDAPKTFSVRLWIPEFECCGTNVGSVEISPGESVTLEIERSRQPWETDPNAHVSVQVENVPAGEDVSVEYIFDMGGEKAIGRNVGNGKFAMDVRAHASGYVRVHTSWFEKEMRIDVKDLHRGRNIKCPNVFLPPKPKELVKVTFNPREREDLLHQFRLHDRTLRTIFNGDLEKGYEIPSDFDRKKYAKERVRVDLVSNTDKFLKPRTSLIVSEKDGIYISKDPQGKCWLEWRNRDGRFLAIPENFRAGTFNEVTSSLVGRDMVLELAKSKPSWSNDCEKFVRENKSEWLPKIIVSNLCERAIDVTIGQAKTERIDRFNDLKLWGFSPGQKVTLSFVEEGYLPDEYELPTTYTVVGPSALADDRIVKVEDGSFKRKASPYVVILHDDNPKIETVFSVNGTWKTGTGSRIDLDDHVSVAVFNIKVSVDGEYVIHVNSPEINGKRPPLKPTAVRNSASQVVLNAEFTNDFWKARRGQCLVFDVREAQGKKKKEIEAERKRKQKEQEERDKKKAEQEEELKKQRENSPIDIPDEKKNTFRDKITTAWNQFGKEQALNWFFQYNPKTGKEILVGGEHLVDAVVHNLRLKNENFNENTSAGREAIFYELMGEKEKQSPTTQEILEEFKKSTRQIRHSK